MTKPVPLDIAEVARLEESRIARGVALIADESEPIAGGKMCFAGVGSWANQAMGLGMNGPVSAGEIDRLIAFFEARGVEPRIELCPFADRSLVSALADRGFVVREFENVLAADLRSLALPPVADGVEVVRVDPTDERQLETFMSITRAGFAPPDPEEFARVERRMFTAPGIASFMALVDSEPAAAGSGEFAPPSAALFGMTTLERFRRRGCQRALMIARLRAAQQTGCTYACVHSSPAVATGRNALRLGFQVAYTKAILVRPGPGLVPSP